MYGVVLSYHKRRSPVQPPSVNSGFGQGAVPAGPRGGTRPPEQVQIFTPTPLTAATAMYYTGLSPETGKPVFTEHGLGGKQRQKDILTGRRGA